MALTVRTHILFATIIAGFLLLLPTRTSSTEEICKDVRLKPLHHVCGAVINAAGEPVERTTVTILSDGIEFAAMQTGQDGKFSFDGLKAGHYEIRLQANGFRTFKFPIVVVKPDSKCKQGIEVKLTIGYPENCTGVRLVKP